MQENFPAENGGHSMNLTTHLHLVTRLRTCNPIPPLQLCFHCLIKHRAHFTIYIYPRAIQKSWRSKRSVSCLDFCMWVYVHKTQNWREGNKIVKKWVAGLPFCWWREMDFQKRFEIQWVSKKKKSLSPSPLLSS